MNLGNLTKKKIIIIGAGLSGLTAGIYCLDNGFDVEIYEKHSIPGGECTGWTRRGQYIDGCAHWIVGTNPRSELYPLWEHIGAFENNPAIFKTEYISKFTLDDGRVFTFWSDLSKLQNEMLEFFPEDKKNIRIQHIEGSFIQLNSNGDIEIEAKRHVRINCSGAKYIKQF